ncbi:MAG: DUF5667 domain-containing protein [Patescibacteria group bacterium]
MQQNNEEKQILFSNSAKNEFTLIYLYLLAGITLLIAVFLFVKPVSAQTEDSASVPAAVETPAMDAQAGPAPQETEVSEPQPVPEEPQVMEVTEPPVEPPETASAAAVIDETVRPEDLGTNESRILPDSPFYGFKRFGRALREAVTFNPVKKAEVRLQNANQELADASRLLEIKGPDQKVFEAVSGAVERFEGRIEKIKNGAEGLREKKAAGDQQVDRLLDNILDKQIKQQKILEKIENHVAVQAEGAAGGMNVLEKIQQARDESAGAVGEVLFAVEKNSGHMVERLDRIMENQRGSEFKEIRNLEILKQIADQAPEEAKAALEQAEDNALNRFKKNFAQMPDEERGGQFELYAEGMGGDETRHLEIFDKLKQLEDAPLELLEKAEMAKDIAARRFQNKLEQAEESSFDEGFRQRMKERMFSRFEEGGPDVSKLRALEEIRQRVKTEDEDLKMEIEERQKEAVGKFRETFTDLGSQEMANKFEELSKKMAANPDPTTFRLLADLEKEAALDPSKKEFIEKMQREAKQQFVERAAKEKDKFFERIASTNPDDVKVLKELQAQFTENPNDFFGPPPFGEAGPPPFGNESMPPGVGPEGFGPPQFGETSPPPFTAGGFAPPGFGQFFDQAIGKQTEMMVKNLNSMENPEAFAQFQDKLRFTPPEILQEITNRQGGFGQMFAEKRDVMQDKQIRRKSEEERQKFDQEFKAKFSEVKSEEERKTVEQEYQQKQIDFRQKDLERRGEIFEKNVQLNPFCDERCQQEERGQFTKQLDIERQKNGEMQKYYDTTRETERFLEEQARQQMDGQAQKMIPQEPSLPSGEGQNNYRQPAVEPRMNERPMIDGGQVDTFKREDFRGQDFSSDRFEGQKPDFVGSGESGGAAPNQPQNFQPMMEQRKMTEPANRMPISEPTHRTPIMQPMSQPNGGFGASEPRQFESNQPAPVQQPSVKPDFQPQPMNSFSPAPQPTTPAGGGNSPAPNTSLLLDVRIARGLIEQFVPIFRFFNIGAAAAEEGYGIR